MEKLVAGLWMNVQSLRAAEKCQVTPHEAFLKFPDVLSLLIGQYLMEIENLAAQLKYFMYSMCIFFYFDAYS